MPVFETFAKRMKARATAGQADVYQYTTIPKLLRRQMMLVLVASLGRWAHTPYHLSGNEYWSAVAGIMERESLAFPPRGDDTDLDRCMRVIAGSEDVGEWLSVIELCCRLLSNMCEHNAEYARQQCGAEQLADDALTEINARFRENGFGFQYENGQIIKIDEQYIHSEMVKPVLQLLSVRGFEKASEDFLTAHRHYRAGEAQDAVVAANRAFESALKAICKARKWSYPEGARTKELVTAARNNGLFPEYLDDGLNTYVALLKTGLPGVRNNAGGHGSAPNAPSVPSYMAAYAIHLTAANIVLVISAHNAR